MNYTIFWIIIFIVLLEASAQYCIKRSNIDKNVNWFCGGLMLYALVSLSLFFSYNYSQMGLVNAIWSAFSVLLIILIGIYMYHETINSYDILGILFIVIGIFLIFIYGHMN